MPSPAVRQVDPAIAEAALGTFADEPAKPAVAPSAPVSGRVRVEVCLCRNLLSLHLTVFVVNVRLVVSRFQSICPFCKQRCCRMSIMW